MSLQTDLHARLERIRELWRELEGTRTTSGSYNVLVDVIRTESSAYLTLLETERGRDPAAGRTPARTELLSHPNRVHTQVERIKKLWLELEGTGRTSARYLTLLELINAESLGADLDQRHDFND
jgi:hypothetical protein